MSDTANAQSATVERTPECYTADSNSHMTIRVMHVGLGPIGAAIARQLAARNGFRSVAAVDIDPSKIGRDAGDVTELGRPFRFKVTDDLRKAAKSASPPAIRATRWSTRCASASSARAT